MLARNGGLVMISALAMGEAVSALEAVGYSGLLFFFALYAYVKAQGSSEKARSVAAAEPSDSEPLCAEERAAPGAGPPRRMCG